MIHSDIARCCPINARPDAVVRMPAKTVDWASIDMDHHVEDIERLREHLGVERWTVFGISWGTVLGATYAERHPERVVALVFAAVSTGTAADIDWLTVSAGRFYPAAHRDFCEHVPVEMRNERLVDAYNTLLMDPDPQAREAAAVAWSVGGGTRWGRFEWLD